MSFLSRKNSRPDRRGGKPAAGRRADSEYDDYGYAPEVYQDEAYQGHEDDTWSPDEYFSPDGIKGRWAAGTRPGERPGVGGQRGGPDSGYDPRYSDPGYGDPRYDDPRYSDPGYGDPRYDDSRYADPPSDGYGYQADSYQGDGYGQDEPYGNEDYETGAYDLTEDDGDGRGDPAASAGRSGRGGRSGRKRRDRADRPERSERRRRLGRKDKEEEFWPDDGVSDEDYWASVSAERPFNAANGMMDASAKQPEDGRPVARPAAAASHGDPRAADPRNGSGRLGPPPGLSPAAASAAGPNGYAPGAPGRPGANGSGSGPMPRSATGPNAVRPGTSRSGPWPAPARPAAGMAQPNGRHGDPSQHGYAQPGYSQASPPQPSFRPNGTQPNGTRAAGRQPDRAERPDWNERTERMDRVPAAGYPDPRQNGRAHNGRSHNGHGRAPEGRAPEGRAPEGRAPDGRAPEGRGRDIWSQDINGYDTGSQPRIGAAGADDDPLTSKAYSRAALTDTDGRSYRAARRSQSSADRREAALGEETQAFTTTGAYPAEPQPAAARYPGGYGAQQSGQHPYDHGNAASYPYSSQPYPSRGDQEQDGGRYRSPRPAGRGGAHRANGNGNGGNPGRR